MVIKYQATNQDDWVTEGTLCVPKALLHRQFTTSQLAFLVGLFCLEDNFLSKSHNQHKARWIFASNNLFLKMFRISKKSIPRIRESLRQMRIIEYKRGYTGRSTSYRILIDNFYLADRLMGDKS